MLTSISGLFRSVLPAVESGAPTALLPKIQVNQEDLKKTARQVASLIDHTLLKPEATRADVLNICQDAVTYQFASVCVNPVWVPVVAEKLKSTSVKVCTVIGFPLGANTTETKLFEAKEALSQGAQEIDMVQNIGAVRSGYWDAVRIEVEHIAELAHEHSAILKVILETSLLTAEEKQASCQLAVKAKADFVKTSTGFSSGGATVDDVRLMRQVVGEGVGVKASGGIRDLKTLQAMVSAGANRIGASAGVQIVEELLNRPKLDTVRQQDPNTY